MSLRCVVCCCCCRRCGVRPERDKEPNMAAHTGGALPPTPRRNMALSSHFLYVRVDRTENDNACVWVDALCGNYLNVYTMLSTHALLRGSPSTSMSSSSTSLSRVCVRYYRGSPGACACVWRNSQIMCGRTHKKRCACARAGAARHSTRVVVLVC